MSGTTRLAASAVVGGLALLCTPVVARAQVAAQPVTRLASLATGSLQGTVQDEQGAPVGGAVVSALGATTAVATTDRSGRFVIERLSPGPYLVRAHLTGFIASHGQIIDVRPSSRASSSIALRRVASDPSASYRVLAAGVAALPDSEPPQPAGEVASAGNDDHGETAWRLRHARRGILRDATVPDAIIADDGSDANAFGTASFLGRSFGSTARIAGNFFTDTVFSGQVNLLTTGAFDTPQQLFTVDSFSRGVAYMAVSAPAGASADWTVRGALTQGDIASWIVAGSYATRVAARHRYDIGMSYATQRYGGGNPAALRDVTDGSRNAGAMYAFDTFAITPVVSLTYGSRYSRYDYLENRGLLSPRGALTISPVDHLRISTIVSSRALAPGAEEFLPPGDTGIWLPPQRTFSSLAGDRPLHAERATHVEMEIERDLVAGATLSFRTFHQRVDNQLVTLFGVQVPGTAAAEIGHYFVGNSGNLDATGWSAGARAAIAGRVHASVEYSLAHARWTPGGDLAYIVLVAPSALRLGSDRVQDVSTSIETDVPETSTHVLVLYRLSNGFARADAPGQTPGEHPGLDSRFDVQVRQALPFMNFSNARWEMLLAVDNFFRETTADQSIYDELLVVRPPKRVVGGLTLRF
jgi:TonB dependent receptor/Carboxypeptidase regulatory-like domain